MKYFLTLILLFGCSQGEVKKTNPYKTAILIEGLASYQLGFVRNVYEEPLKELGYTVHSVPYTTKMELKADICIGHSFGGGKLIRDAKGCKLSITMDAREWKASNNSKYVSHKELGKHYNFYQVSGLRGYEVKGAVNKKVDATHTGLPFVCFDEVMGIIK